MLTASTRFHVDDPDLGAWSFTLGQMRRLRAALVALADEFEASGGMEELLAAVAIREDIATADAYISDAIDGYIDRKGARSSRSRTRCAFNKEY
jgi:hypothetical protein